MAEILASTIDREKFAGWFVERLRPRPLPLPGDPEPIDPAPLWLVEALDDAAFHKYLDASVALRTKELQLEIDRLQVIQGLLSTLPGPLPHEG